MAKRFGGRFSPHAGPRGLAPAPAARPAQQIRHPYESRTSWVTAMATPFLLTAPFHDPVGMATNLAAFGITAGAMWLTREGLQAEAAYDARRVARKPAIPRKLFGGILTGLGLAVGVAEPGSFAGAGVLGFTAAILHWLSFGPDPMRDKGMEGVDAFQQDRAARMIEDAEAHLRGMTDAILRTGDRRLEARVSMFAATARNLFDRVEQDPGGLAAARRYLGVYLQGARDATSKFADLYAQTRDPQARADYEALLGDLEASFDALTRRLHEGGRTDMDIEIEVLRDRLAREGVRPSATAALEGRREPTAAETFGQALRETLKDRSR
ncbi:5-bromo-4-chloroindolyl phosphate hydrolysis family protein [Paracoccus sphaerophysae]|uniref:5-bromo-4-chloroindolyl phosphate hydrolysis family protein n=1 Tax=Paracoccus sphaerophysae TaxID=690417 RepID=UPI002353570C|nr:5-bromo-4-chloroindolyl phosphate hydrolysis family protein [Paracoccus sphaerophysae]